MSDALEKKILQLERKLEIEEALNQIQVESARMQSTDDLRHVIKAVGAQFIELNIRFDHVSFGWIDSPLEHSFWTCLYGYPEPMKVHVPFLNHKINRRLEKAIKLGEGFFSEFQTVDSNRSWTQHLLDNGELSFLNKDQIEIILNSGVARSVAITSNLALVVANYLQKPYSDEENEIIQRFATAFDQAYRRFLDLQIAEKQAKQAQIEAALERVRARSMAMHESHELSEIAMTLSDELRELNFPELFEVGYIKWDEEDMLQKGWLSDFEGKNMEPFKLPLQGDRVLDERYQGLKNQTPLLYQRIGSKELYDHVQFCLPTVGSEQVKQQVDQHFSDPTHFYHSFFKEGALCLIAQVALTEEQQEILVRFRKVFEQSYRRFLDIQIAEAQTRQAQIETALERVRSKSMAMHHSDQLGEVVDTLFAQFSELNIMLDSCFLNVFEEGSDDMNVWAGTSESVYQSRIRIPYFDHPFFTRLVEARSNKETFFTQDMDRSVKDAFFDHFFTKAVFSDSSVNVPKQRQEAIRQSSGFTYSAALSEHACLTLANYRNIPYSEDENEIVRRIGNAFEQAYTRFLDLQKAEAQAREAQIETALERVRSQAMAMHTSDNLHETISEFFIQLKQLDIVPVRCGVAQVFSDPPSWRATATNATIQGDTVELSGKVGNLSHPVLQGIYDSWNQQKDYFPILKGVELKEYYKVLRDDIAVPEFQSDEVHHGHYFNFKEGNVYAWTYEPLSDDEKSIFKRFSSVLSLTYRRYLDLKESEAQAREAQVEAALERVRASSMAMHKSHELHQVVKVIFDATKELGIELDSVNFCIFQDNSRGITVWFAATNVEHSESIDLPAIELGPTKAMMDARERGEDFIIYQCQGEEKRKWFEFVFANTNYADIPESRKEMLLNTEFWTVSISLGNFSAIQFNRYNTSTFSNSENQILKRLGNAFEQSYTRFLDLKKAEEQAQEIKEEKERLEIALEKLQNTQTQLVHAEKMASLGELTAGIAHEIQNPLNFVNNFSDINRELIEELKEELEAGNYEEVKFITGDLEENESKITHHGKRAEEIVRSMLQHSRGSEGVKEPTDINALCDEYLRLAFHGLRAKDKSFNADFKLELDESLPKIEVIPQDIGRVLLNLINNAFQATSSEARSRAQGDGQSETYSPLVIVKTEGDGDQVKITVTDNGPGIPDDIKDKIFQPFFTTKPTGQGTGLGLSMSYDIVTKGHGGSMQFETALGKGSTFIIRLYE